MFNDVFNNSFKCTTDVPNKYFITIEQETFYGRTKLETVLSILKISFSEDVLYDNVIQGKEIDADQIEKVVLNVFNMITACGDAYYREYKVIAGIVRICKGKLHVVAIGTGSKFLSSPPVNHKGNTLIDAHAEVVTRRAFVRYLYCELHKFIQNFPDTIFKRSTDQLLELKPDNTFHLYVSTAPCGDGRVYSHSDAEYSSPADISEGTLRTKGEGALTVLKDVSCKGAHSNGFPLESISMSCSAKVLRWNVLGMQGALLGKHIAPIYLSSIIFGDKFDQKHLKRALYGRIEDQLKDLPTNYRLNKPLLLEVTNTLSKPNLTSPVHHSCNWFYTPGKLGVEVIDARNGQVATIHKNFSQISKRAFLNEFMKTGDLLREKVEDTDYATVKLTSKGYNVSMTGDLSLEIVMSHIYFLTGSKRVFPGSCQTQ